MQALLISVVNYKRTYYGCKSNGIKLLQKERTFVLNYFACIPLDSKKVTSHLDLYSYPLLEIDLREFNVDQSKGVLTMLSYLKI